MKTRFLILISILFIILCSFQGTTNGWSILKAVQYNLIPDSTNVLGFKMDAIKNPEILAIDGTTITLKGYFHKVPGAPKIFNKILFSQHDNWNRGCAVGMPLNYTLELTRTAEYKVYYNRPCFIQGKLTMNWDVQQKERQFNQLTEVRCLYCE
jgi:hypothetical protein